MTGEVGPDDREVNAIPVRPGRCENCDRDDTELVAVHRVYVTPESWDTPRASTVVEDREWWCFTCRSMYPHHIDPPA